MTGSITHCVARGEKITLWTVTVITKLENISKQLPVIVQKGYMSPGVGLM